MTRRATHAFIHMNRVIEVGEVRQVMHAHPLKRLAGLETCAHWLEIRTVGPNLFVTAHANRGRRNPCGRRSLDRRMTVTAVNAVIADVVLVTELNWLLALDVRARVPARAVDLGGDKQRGDQNEYRAEDRGPRQIVCAVTENLWHRRRIVVFRLTADLSAITVSGGEAPPLNLSIQFIELLKPLTLTRSRFFFKRLQEEVIGCAVTNVCRTLRIRACRQATRAPHV